MLHASGCLTQLDPPGMCNCEAIEDSLLRTARPSAADLIRQGKAKGLISGTVQGYGGYVPPVTV